MSAGVVLSEAKMNHRIFEKLSHPGGHAITVEDSGFRFDRTGHLLHLRDPEMRERVLGWIGDDHYEVQRRSTIWSNGVYTRYPFQANTFGLPPDVANECVLGFIRAHFAPKTREPENFEEFCLQHFGEGISRHFMIPYNCRLWGVHPREITPAWCQRFVPIPKLEDVIAGAVGLNDRELGYNANFVYPRLGIGVLSENIAKGLPRLELGREPLGIDYRNRRIHFADEVVSYSSFISTVPLPILIGLLEGPPVEVREAARKLRCTHLYYLDVALETPCQKDIHWIYVPEEKYPYYRVGCYSHFSPHLAPPGKACLYVELADRAEPDMAALLPRVADGLVEMQLIRRVEDVAFARLRRIDYAYVIFDHEYYGALQVIRPFLDEIGIQSAGRYGNWTYSSMEDALLYGRDAARAVLASP